MTGTASQIEWAGQIRLQVEAEFRRVARTLRSPGLQMETQRAEYFTRWLAPGNTRNSGTAGSKVIDEAG